MVRSVADRAFLPVRNAVGEIGDMVILTFKTIVSAVRPPYPYGNEFVEQFIFILRVCWFPLLVATVAFGFAVPGLQGANTLILVGAMDRLGGVFVLSMLRGLGPFITAIIVSGVAGTAVTSDLGARKIREELDALQVLGVDSIKNLVVPRFLALMLLTALFNVFVVIVGIAGGLITDWYFHEQLAGFWATFATNATTDALFWGVVTTIFFGAIISIVACYKGMSASGGAEGVGRAVNQSVVISMLAVFAFYYVFNQIVIAANPSQLIIK